MYEREADPSTKKPCQNARAILVSARVGVRRRSLPPVLVGSRLRPGLNGARFTVAEFVAQGTERTRSTHLRRVSPVCRNIRVFTGSDALPRFGIERQKNLEGRPPLLVDPSYSSQQAFGQAGKPESLSGSQVHADAPGTVYDDPGATLRRDTRFPSTKVAARSKYISSGEF